LKSKHKYGKQVSPTTWQRKWMVPIGSTSLPNYSTTRTIRNNESHFCF